MTIALQVAITLTGAYYLLKGITAVVASATALGMVQRAMTQTGKTLQAGQSAAMDKAMGKSVIGFGLAILWWVPLVILAWII